MNNVRHEKTGFSVYRLGGVRLLLTVFFLIVFLTAARAGYINEQGNFYPVTEGLAYRSAQLDIETLEHYIIKHGIKTVINLRGGSPGAKWWEDERDTCKRLMVAHYDIGLSARKYPKPERINALIDIFLTAQRPILIHCKAGSDRTGLASAIWKSVVDHEPYSEAKKQLSIFYGHLPFGSSRAMDNFFMGWQASFEKQQAGVKPDVMDNVRSEIIAL